MPTTDAIADLGRESPLGARKRPQEDTEMDITPMIDCTFLLLIFFTVTSTPDAQTALNLATAKYGVGISQRDSIIISIAENGESQPALVYLADGKAGEPLKGSPADQDAEVRNAVEEGLKAGKSEILIKAESGVLHRDVSRVAAAAGGVSETLKLNLAVMEAK